MAPQAMTLGASAPQPGLADVSPKVSRPIGRPGRAVQAVAASSARMTDRTPLDPEAVPRDTAGKRVRAATGQVAAAPGNPPPSVGNAVRSVRFANIQRATVAIGEAGDPTVVRVEAAATESAEPAVKAGSADLPRAETTQQPQPTSESVSDQIAAQLRVDPGTASQRVVVRLDPPELGRVSVTLEETDGQLQGELRFSDPEAMAQARLETPALIRQLAEGGVRVRQLDISLEADGLQHQLDWTGRQSPHQDQQSWGDWLGEAAEEVAPSEEAPDDPVAAASGNPSDEGSAINLRV